MEIQDWKAGEDTVNFAEFGLTSEENALSESSDGVGNSSWARFHVFRVLQVDWSRNKSCQSIPDGAMKFATFFPLNEMRG